MSRSVTGWIFVGIQAILLVTLILLPTNDDWPTPGLVTGIGLVLTLLGVIVMTIAALRLGGSLRPSPVPAATGELQTVGLYRYVRHPIYSGVLAVVVGLAIRSGSLVTLAVAALTIGFFVVKAKWEEQQLAEHYPDYLAYAARTPRFFPLRVMRGNPDT